MENKELSSEGFSIKKLYSEHKKPFIAITALILALVIAFGCVLPIVLLVGNKDNGNDDDGGDTPGGSVVGGGGTAGETEYTVKVVTVGGMPLEDITVYIHSGDGYNLCTMPQNTDANGIAKFTLPTSNEYSVQVEGAPEGYSVKEGLTRDDRYALTAPDTLITLSSAPIKDGGFKSSYDLGDVMYDFTLTDVTGKSYKLSDLLKTKDMVMLNFWYVDCSNCYYEFPYINTVYEAYKDDIEILAINDYADDTKQEVAAYPEYLGEELKMPLFKVGNTADDLTLSKFPSNGYPTTVIIDRYGVITMIEVGAVLGESKWKNIFDYFVGDDYKQTLIDDPSMLNPIIEPTIKWTDTSAQEIANAFNSGDIKVTYHPETSEKDAKYAWPFVVDTFNGETVVRPSNVGIDNSFSILYAEVELKPGQAITFEWFASTQNNDMGTDVLYVLVDGKDIYSIAGISEDGFQTCCTYVDPRPVTNSNKDVVATYSVAFAYYKDTVDAEGDDTVYLKNLKVIDANDIDVETYIFRYAATDLNANGDGYDTYVEVYLAEDGYYRVGDPSKGTNNPLLLANHLSYTQFDPYKTVSERMYADGTYTFMVDGVNKFNNWLIYGNAASNSQMSYYTPVTEELKEILVAYCDTHRREVGKAANENLWLQLCVYFDAYGKDKDGNPTEQLPNPIQGLTSFSAFEMEITEQNPTVEGQIVSSAEVTYNKVIMPRGYLYKFVPTKSGVYRVTSKSVGKEVNGWIFVDPEKWAEQGGDRSILTSYEVAERICTDLLVDTNNDGKFEHDNVNTSLVAYMEAGKEYFIDIAYYDVYEVGTFTFDVKWVGETFAHFIQASPGPITYEETLDGSMGKLMAGGIDVDFKDGYAYHVLERDADGNVTKWGSLIYADFYYPTTLFQTQSIQALIKANAFNFHITETDREALVLIDGIRINGRNYIIEQWKLNEIITETSAGEAKWVNDGYDAAIKDYYDGDFDSEYSEEVKNTVLLAWNEGVNDLKKDWGIKAITSAAWDTYEMDKAIRGEFSDDTSKANKQQELLRVVESTYDTNWAHYQMDDVRCGIYHNTDNRTDKDIKGLKYLEIYKNEGKESLKAYWDAEYDSLIPEDTSVTDVSEWRFEIVWDLYKMDDLNREDPIFHGTTKDYTAEMLEYAAKMENDGTVNAERQGCVAVTEELALILDALIAHYVFEDVENGWLKFCFYYNYLGV